MKREGSAQNLRFSSWSQRPQNAPTLPSARTYQPSSKAEK